MVTRAAESENELGFYIGPLEMVELAYAPYAL